MSDLYMDAHMLNGDVGDEQEHVGGQPHDMVDHPPHYQSGNGIECIDAIHAALGDQGFVDHCRGTAIKYAWRSGKKTEHAEDLRKAAWYLERAAQVLETSS